MKDFTEEEAFEKMTAWCSTAERCRSEVSEKLQRWSVSYAIINKVIDRLIDGGYINEERYCRAFIRDKYRLEKWGKQKIAKALYVKRIPQHIFNTQWDVIDNDEYQSILHKLLQNKRKSIHADDEKSLNEKLIRFALSRGYDYNDIRQHLDISDELEENEWEM